MRASHAMAGAFNQLFFNYFFIVSSAYTVYSFFQSLGELGLLGPRGFAAILMGRPQTFSAVTGPCADDRDAYKADQQAAVLRAIAEYSNPDVRHSVPVVFNLDFGHTDPQCLVPSGGTVFIDSAQQQIEFCFQAHAILKDMARDPE
eukprot:COSAG01_NODE_2517_length_7524_cov_19.201616_7_plen_146_part_00